LLPESTAGWPVSVTCDLDTALADADVAYVLRIQRERQRVALFPSVQEYRTRYGLTSERAARLGPDGLVMHPGPMNRGVEMAVEVAESPVSVVTEQVTNGVAVRMAVLYRILGSGAPVA
jgi:aspartate carbamoyltransferase catalytic subunit